MADSTPKRPHWIKNTYFWIAAVLFIVGIWGLPFLGGQDSIRDPGQADENGLSLIYFVGAVAMLVNGLVSHRLTMQQYDEQRDKE